MSFFDPDLERMEVCSHRDPSQNTPVYWDPSGLQFKLGIPLEPFPSLTLGFDFTPRKRTDLQTSLKSLQASEARNSMALSPFAKSQNKRLDFSPIKQPYSGQKVLSSAEKENHFDTFFQMTQTKPPIAFLPEAVNASRRLWPPKQLSFSGCNCRNSKCLKNYCECLRKGVTCNGCNCQDCENHSHSPFLLDKLKKKEKNDARPPRNDIPKGCSCRRSRCLKNYCECYQAGAGCGEHCKCLNCSNGIQTNANR